MAIKRQRTTKPYSKPVLSINPLNDLPWAEKSINDSRRV
jgi:hypothetical protein